MTSTGPQNNKAPRHVLFSKDCSKREILSSHSLLKKGRWVLAGHSTTGLQRSAKAKREHVPRATCWRSLSLFLTLSLFFIGGFCSRAFLERRSPEVPRKPYGSAGSGRRRPQSGWEPLS